MDMVLLDPAVSETHTARFGSFHVSSVPYGTCSWEEGEVLARLGAGADTVLSRVGANLVHRGAQSPYSAVMSVCGQAGAHLSEVLPVSRSC